MLTIPIRSEKDCFSIAADHAAARQADSGPTVNLDAQQIDPDCLELISRRQAWQFRTLPLRVENGHLVIAATRQSLDRAVRIAMARNGHPVFALICSEEQIERYLREYYPWKSLQAIRDRGLN